MDYGLILGLAALLTAGAAIFRNWSQRGLDRSAEAVNWEALANRATSALMDERGEHSRQLEEMKQAHGVISERLEICEQRWTLVSPLLKTWSNGRVLESQIVDRINELSARAEELKQTPASPEE